MMYSLLAYNFKVSVSKFTIVFLIVMGLFNIPIAKAQYKQLRGSVVDENGIPVADVSITNKRDYPLGKSNSNGAFVFNYQIPMSGAAPTFYFSKDGYDTYYWEYDGQEHKKVVLSKIVVIEYQKITGIIMDESGKPLSKVKIYSRSHNIKGNYSSTVSNLKGQFSFSYPLLDKPIKIKFQKPGFKSFFWKYEGKDKVSIKLSKIAVE